MIASGVNRRAVPARAGELAARLAVLFERDVEIVKRLNDAQRRLHGANERLWSGLAPDAFGLVCDGSAFAGESQLAALMSGALGGDGAVLSALQETHCAIRKAFLDHQWACEERRQLAVDVGELSQQLIGVLGAAGWSVEAARGADVHELARGGIR